MRLRLRIVLTIVIGLFAGASLTQAASTSTSKLPNDVARFIEKRTMCDHFRGEDAYNADRARFIASKVKENCGGTDAALSGLRAKYRTRADVLAALADFEYPIE